MKPSEKTAQKVDKNIDQRRAAAEERIAELFAQQVDETFMRENFIGLGETLWRYMVLKDAYKMGDVGKWRDFQKAFAKFYAIQRFISPEWYKQYYKEMEHLKGKKIPEVSAITEQLTDKWDRMVIRSRQKKFNSRLSPNY